ncbi:MAG: hypothetical protein CM15mP77_2130 [Synechococcus sp.]|nr:MAG: hypothetical protein CM15mP77_2130 [Synechococcus sp.]
MGEVFEKWRTYVPADQSLRGGRSCWERGHAHEWRETHLLGFAEDMAMPMAFLDPYLNNE